MKKMSFGSHLDGFMAEMIAQGRYRDEQEMLRDGLSMLEMMEHNEHRRLEILRAEIQKRDACAKFGHGQNYNVAQHHRKRKYKAQKIEIIEVLHRLLDFHLILPRFFATKSPHEAAARLLRGPTAPPDRANAEPALS